jgi:hypothetical protein
MELNATVREQLPGALRAVVGNETCVECVVRTRHAAWRTKSHTRGCSDWAVRADQGI